MKLEDQSKDQLIRNINKLVEDINRLKEKDAQHIYTETALLKSKTTSYALLNATSDLAAILDTNGIILEINEAALRRIKKNVTELTGKSLFDFFPPEFKDFRKMYFNIVQQTKEPLRYQDEYLGMILHVCLYPILDKDDEVEKIAAFVSDNTEYRKNDELLYRYSQILSTIHDPIAYIDKNFVFLNVNLAYQEMFKKTINDIVGHPAEAIYGKDFIEKKIKTNLLLCLAGQRIQQQEWFDFPDGKRRCMLMSYYPLFPKDKPTPIGVVLNSIDITKIKELEEELQRLSITDQLTQIYNRTKFNAALSEEIKRLRRYNTELSLVMLDIDHFKHINDTYGHDIGDKVLVSLVQIVKRCIRETDIFSRWGGEEFMLLLPHTNIENSIKLAERIRKKVQETNLETVGTITCSFGVSQFNENDSDESFTKRVDNALYDSKRSGRNRVTWK